MAINFLHALTLLMSFSNQQIKITCYLVVDLNFLRKILEKCFAFCWFFSRRKINFWFINIVDKQNTQAQDKSDVKFILWVKRRIFNQKYE